MALGLVNRIMYKQLITAINAVITLTTNFLVLTITSSRTHENILYARVESLGFQENVAFVYYVANI